MKYKEKYNYMRALGIRPRGCESVLQTVVNGVIEIVGKVVGSTRFIHSINFKWIHRIGNFNFEHKQ